VEIGSVAHVQVLHLLLHLLEKKQEFHALGSKRHRKLFSYVALRHTRFSFQLFHQKSGFDDETVPCFQRSFADISAALCFRSKLNVPEY